MKKRKKQGHDRAIDWIILHGWLAAFCLLMYPSFMDCLSYIGQTSVIGAYEESAGEWTDAEIEEQIAQVRSYNDALYAKQQKNAFVYTGEQYEDPVYDALLNPSLQDEDRVMGYLEMDSIHLYLPIAHGTKSAYLRYELGHIYGTSLPIPTGNTRAVIAGHTGLKEALLFTNLTKVSKGDIFSIHILGKKYSYQVTRIEIVTPKQADSHLQIEEGKDQVTLFTCTPYGINDHRLLVTGDFVKEETCEKSNEWITHQKNTKYKRILFLLICLPTAGMVIGSWRIRRKK